MIYPYPIYFLYQVTFPQEHFCLLGFKLWKKKRRIEYGYSTSLESFLSQFPEGCIARKVATVETSGSFKGSK